MRYALAIALITLLAAGCGDDAKSKQQSTPSSGTTELTITLNDGKQVELSCPGGPEAACALLDETGADLFDPPAGNQACTMQYGGPETAHVEGTVDGEEVLADFSRANGCEISRWEAASRLWGASGTDSSSGADANLTLTFDAGPFKGMVMNVTCPTEDQTKACDLLEEQGADMFNPVAKDSACTEIFGGEDVVRIEGSVGGEDVDAILNRSNGCEIARFDNAEPLWSDSLAAG